MPLKPPVVVTVPGRSEMASSLPLSVRFDQGRLQSQPEIAFFEAFSVRVNDSAVENGTPPHATILEWSPITCLLGVSNRSRIALKSCVAPWRAPNNSFIRRLISGKSGVSKSSWGTLFHPTCI